MTSTAVLRDRYDLSLSTASTEAAARYVEGVDRTLAGDAGQEQCFRAAIAADEGFALAHVALARTLQFQGQVAEARTLAARARDLAAGTTPREQGHVAAIATAVAGDQAGALDLVREHVAEFPRDAFVLSQASGVYGLIGFSGRSSRNEEQFALLDGVAAAYGDDWWFLSAYAFAHNELFRFAEARRLIDRSLALYERNAHGSHTLAHVQFETGAAEEGASFLSGWLTGYERAAQLHCHLSWHLCLFELTGGHYQRALAIYDDAIRPGASRSTALGAVADAASLLWRCGLYGYTGPLPMAEVREYAARSFPRAGVTFADMHCALTYAATRDEAALTALVDDLRGRLAQGRLPAGECVIDLALGIGAFGRGDYEEAVRRLDPVADQVIRIGGSHAQRELFEDTLLECHLRTGGYDRAEALLRTRLARRETPRDLFWLGRAQRGAGDEGAVATLAEARRRWQDADPTAPEPALLAALEAQPSGR